MRDRESAAQEMGMQELRRAIDGVEEGRISVVGVNGARVPVMAPGGADQGDPKVETGGVMASHVYYAVKNDDRARDPDGCSARIDERGSLHVTVTYESGSWEDASPDW